jgi:hypothetical protein
MPRKPTEPAAPITSRKGLLPKKPVVVETTHVDELIAEKLRTAPVLSLCQVDNTVHTLVEIWCGKVLTPKQITAYLDRKVKDGTIAAYTKRQPRRYNANDPGSVLVYGFEITKPDVEKLGIDRYEIGRGQRHLDLG